MELNRLVKAAGLTAAALGIAMLAGCSSSSSDDTASSPAATSASAAASSAAASPSAGMTGPIVVEPGTTEVTMEKGQTLDIKVEGDPADWKIETDNPDVLAVSQGGKQGDAVMNPGAEAILNGQAKLLLTNSTDNSTWEIAVTVGAA